LRADPLERPTRPPLYGPQQSVFARYLERREARRPDPVGRELRRRLLSGLRGRALEVGSGDGRSFEYYPTRVTGLLAVEPDPTARAMAAEQARRAAVPIEVVAGVAEALPVKDGAFDAAVVMGVLCTVPEPAVALSELRRVLAAGGELRFWEHVRAEHVLFRGVQRVVDALFWTRALSGCETTRDTEAAIRDAGFQMLAIDRGFHSSSFLTITSAPYILGIARR
jgi:SAM-dependent methyltransferase